MKDEIDVVGGPDRKLDPETVSELLKERVYASLTGLSTVLVLLGAGEDTTVRGAVASVGVTMFGLYAAGLVADIVAHAAVHGSVPRGEQLRRMRRVAGQALETATVPLVLIGLGATRLWTLHTGLVAAAVALVVTLVAVALVAVRRSRLGPVGRAAIVLGELALAGVVIAIKLLAH